MQCAKKSLASEFKEARQLQQQNRNHNHESIPDVEPTGGRNVRYCRPWSTQRHRREGRYQADEAEVLLLGGSHESSGG